MNDSNNRTIDYVTIMLLGYVHPEFKMADESLLMLLEVSGEQDLGLFFFKHILKY